MCLKSAFLYLAYKTVRQSQQPVEIIVGVTAFCLLLANLPSPVVFNAVTGAFYWGTVGAMLGVWSLQRIRRGVNPVHTH
jgi:hypothetical protein